MTITTNKVGWGDTGQNQKELTEYMQHIHAALRGICAKLDGDGGITDTDYGAACDLVIASGASPLTDYTFATEAAKVTA